MAQLGAVLRHNERGEAAERRQLRVGVAGQLLEPWIGPGEHEPEIILDTQHVKGLCNDTGEAFRAGD